MRVNEAGKAFGDDPLDFSRPELRAIWDLLSQAIYQSSDIAAIARAAGLPPLHMGLSDNSRRRWKGTLDAAKTSGRMTELLEAVRAARPTLGARLAELTGQVTVLEARTGGAAGLRQPDGPGWQGFGQEELVVAGSNTLLGIAFLSVGLSRSRSICRIRASFPGGKEFVGTAALIGPNLLLTNHHVLHDWENRDRAARTAEAWFGFEDDEAGLSRQLTIVGCDATTIVGERAHDWAVVRTTKAPPSDTPVLLLRGAPAPQVNDYVFIIQHPDGGPKMIALSHNLVRSVTNDVLQYWTDTKSGSSGAPVFNRHWQVVGLHHHWVEAPAEDGVDYRNQGRRIERVIEGLTRHRFTVS